VYLAYQQRLIVRLREFIKAAYNLESERVVVEQPPRVEYGEFATPIAFELARRLRKAPRKIAEEIVAGLGRIDGFEKLEVAGAGYINAYLNRAVFAKTVAAGSTRPNAPGGKVLVEHTSINPNKAAHIGHLRNAILGDTFVRLLRASGKEVDVQNYIDNTGVQVADVVVGFLHVAKKSSSEVEALIASESRFDYYCWELYARTQHWYEQDPANKKIRLEILHAIEQGGNNTAQVAEMVSTAVLRLHLETMLRLGILYDFLPRESEILHLHFWEAAFAQLKDRGVLYLETQGKNQGCWVMKRAAGRAPVDADIDEPKEDGPSSGEPDEDAKVIVRSNGTVTYVGKDIAYHLWKFGLLGLDFQYKKFFHYPADKKRDTFPEGHDCWISSVEGEADHPHFGGVGAIYNVIDSRQTDPQENVVEALRAMGYVEAAARYTHFSYEMVALTPRCALDLGYELNEADRDRTYIEVSGRKGFGVKADDLLDALVGAAQKEVDTRQENVQPGKRLEIATQIAVGALRYFMLKFTKNSVIAFDFKEALSFEGDTGPYLQYAVVRATNILRKACMSPREVFSTVAELDFTELFAGEAGDGIWELWLTASKVSLLIGQCIATTEPAHLAKYAFQLAQQFNNFYHKHHILTEEDERRKLQLLATVAVVRRELLASLELMGISVPPVM
jgi:arginyl-tRNA synthetase